jgi:hypothetical protein
VEYTPSFSLFSSDVIAMKGVNSNKATPLKSHGDVIYCRIIAQKDS